MEIDSRNDMIKVLPETFKKNGFFYFLVTRTENKAIFRQTLDNVQVGYEVFIIRVRGAQFSTLLGKIIPPTERFPGNEDFGETAWSFVEYKDALIKFNEL